MVGSRVRTSHSPALELASLVLGAVSGASSRESFASFDRASSSWKTSQLSLFEDSTLSSPILPRSGSMRSGSLCELPTLVRLIAVSGSSWSRGEYPTPTAVDYGSSQNGINGKGGEHERPTAGTPSLSTWARDEWRTPLASDASAKRGDGSTDSHGKPLLPLQARMWATPVASESVNRTRKIVPNKHHGRHLSAQAIDLWPTATATDAKRSGGRSAETNDCHSGVSLTDATCRGIGPQDHRTLTAGAPGSPAEVRLRLSPRFVEALMGLPLDWTLADETTDSAVSAMPSYRRSLK